MNRSDTVITSLDHTGTQCASKYQPNLRMPHDGQDHSRVNRGIRLPSCVSSGLASVISIFCIGLVSGAAGGLLLGATAVVVLQSLELLADNRLLMDQLENYIMGDDYYLEREAKKILQWETYNQVHDIHISIFAELFGVFSSALSLPVGIFVGFSTYQLIIKKWAVGKAFALAGPVCLMGVTSTGYLLGLFFESFLSITLNVSILIWFIVSATVVIVVPVTIEHCFRLHSSYMDVLGGGLLTPGAALIVFVTSFLSEMRLILASVLIPAIIFLRELEKSHSFKLTVTPIPLMLIITDVFHIARQPIVTLQSPTSTNTSSAVLEGMFVGVLTSQLWTIVIGMSLFVSWQSGGAGKTCVSAAASGGAVLGAIKLALPVLGPGPTIGALMGVAGAAGVSLSAAGAVTNRYGQAVGHYGWVGWVGVTVGAAVGTFLSSCAHSGLSGMFMGLCAATIPAGLYLNLLLFHSPSWLFKVCLCINLLTPVILISFTYTGLFYIAFMKFRVVCAYHLGITCASLFICIFF
ncbi:uncharacterized protein LOC121199884 isoform X4 [Toxotes jaculatrix]|uniref:uncharacterized protein LOC121199884 isoform X4 n=1 Tax=Toxotes jaculatrix TaxID=941984 RepID=UPI001B3B1470|nr:uncharacterized protein LOC121199884 isoform X4 [Toxotes jaculatrix]